MPVLLIAETGTPAAGGREKSFERQEEEPEEKGKAERKAKREGRRKPWTKGKSLISPGIYRKPGEMPDPYRRENGQERNGDITG